ncbi:hypothetical protein HELRODRAFT_160181 [Helobdella robusta]|uniref:Endonuclease/exonuclease/phosphatase domain-containing protein n=1 Tax=Helobdella robusta TaxID=6412 RepID=T1EPX7_HELRO|nr:hypothetical protein HELRODRAFT_160181 [Helobdella robusta]ESO06056.1 hypothetical protein HELRODRAFT_160181 [Helobdella robusta]
MVNTTANNHTGSVVARDNKDRIAALGTRSYNEKFVTEFQRGKMKIKFTVGIWNVRSLWQAGIYAMKARRALIEYNPVNDELMYARFKRYPRDSIVIVAYASTTNHSDDEVETFHEQLEQTLKTLPKKDVKIIVGDWNAKIESDNIGFEEVMGKYGVGDRNDRGESYLFPSIRPPLYPLPMPSSPSNAKSDKCFNPSESLKKIKIV